MLISYIVLSQIKRENYPRERIHHTWPSFNENYFQSILGYVSYCVVILRTPLYWSVRVVWCNLAGNSFHCRSRKASDMTCKLGITFADESKDFYVEKSGQRTCRRAKRSWLVEVRRRKRFRKLLIEVFGTSVERHCTKTTTVSSGDIHAHLRAVISSFGSNCGHVTKKQVQSGFKRECLAAKHLNFERALDKCGHTAHYKELTETGNRA